MNSPLLRSRRVLRALVLAGAGALTLTSAIPALAADRIDVQPGPNATVSNMSNADANGNRYVVGRFTAFNAWGTGSGGVVDGTTAAVNRTFPKVNGTVYEVISDARGGWYVGGDFWCVGGDAADDGDCTDPGEFVRNKLVHLNADGSVDATFADPGVQNGVVKALELDTQGDDNPSNDVLYAGGNFTEIGRVSPTSTRNRAAAFDPSGDLTAWDPNVTGVAHHTSQVRDLALASDGVIIGGDFTTVGGTVRAGVVKVNKTSGALTSWNAQLVDTNDTHGEMQNVSEVFAVAVGHGRVYISGRITSMGGSPRWLMGAVSESTAAVDASWKPAVDGIPHAIIPTGDASTGSVYMAGGFAWTGLSTYTGGNGMSVDPATQKLRWRVAELNTINGEPTAWNPGDDSITGVPLDMAVGANSVYITGNMTVVAGTIRSRAASFSRTTAALTSWDPNLGGEWSYAIAEHAGDVYIGGGFTTMGGTKRQGVAGFNQVTGALTGFAPALDNAAHGVGVIGDTLFLSGEFTKAKGATGPLTTREKVAAFDVNTGNLESWNPSTGANTWNMAIDPTRETVFISGDFSLGPPPSGGAHRFGIAAVSGSDTCVENWTSACVRNWNPDMRTDANGNTSGGAMSVAGDHIYFAGHFGSVSGDADHNRLAKVKITEACLETFTAGSCVDASWKPWIIGRGDINSGSPDRCCTATINARDDRIYIGGFFEWLENPALASDRRVRTYAAALDPATGALDAWNPNVGGVVKGIAVTFGNVYLSGSFSQIDGQPRSLLGAVSESTGALQPWDANAVGTEIYSLIAANDTLYAGGLFTSINGEPNYNFARIAPATLTLGVAGPGSGTVQSAGMGISCGTATCENQVAAGSSVTLTAVPDAGSEFDSWTGACSAETSPTCTVSMTEARTVTALFRALVPTPGPDAGAPGAGNSSPPVGATQQQASRTPIAWRVGTPALRAIKGRTRLQVSERIQLSRTGRYTLIYVDSAGKRVPLAKGTRIASRKLDKTFYAPVMRVTGPDSLKISARLARPNAKAITLRVVLRNPDGTLEGQDIPLR